MKKLLVLLLLFGLHCEAQHLDFVRRLPFPDSLVSSEISIDRKGNKLVAAILGVQPTAQNPFYHTVVLSSNNLGESWLTENTRLAEKAADPQIAFLNQQRFVLVDIGEGNQFHLKSYLNKDQSWIKETSHGMGHDYATILADSTGYYVFSTQKKNDRMSLFTYSQKGNQGNSNSIDILNGADLSFKKPILNDSLILLPMVVRGKWDGKESTHFETMSSWLLPLNKRNLEPNTPIFMTHESGAKHHILLKGGNKALYFFFTDVKRKLLKWIASSDGGLTWTGSKPITKSEYLINLDAACWNGEYVVVVFTVEERKGVFQKYLMTVTEETNLQQVIELGEPSIPDNRNGWAARAWPQGGDYCGMIADDSGALYVIWSAATDGLFKPYFSKISFK